MRRIWMLGALFSAATALMLWPLPARILTHLPTVPQDPVFLSVVLDWDLEALTHDPGSVFDSPWLQPRQNVLAQSENLIGIVPLYAGFRWIGLRPITVHNLLFLAFFAFSGASAFLFVRRLVGQTLPGLLAGVVFAFCPYRMDHLFHLNLQCCFWTPLCLLFAFRWLGTQRLRDAAVAAGCFIFQSLSCLQYGLYLAAGVAVFVGTIRWFGTAGMPRIRWVQAALVTAAAGAILLPLSLPYLRLHEANPAVFSRSLDEVIAHSAAFADFFHAPTGNRLWGPATAGMTNGDNWGFEHSLFPGVIALLLAIYGFLWPGANRLAARAGAALAIAAAIFAFGPYLSIGNHVVQLEFNGNLFRIPLPFAVLYEWVPGFSGLRMVTRIWMVGMLGISLLAAVGLSRLQATSAGRRLSPFLLAAALCECASFPIQTSPVPATQDFESAARAIRASGVSALLDFNPEYLVDQRVRSVAFELEAMLRQREHRARIVNGYSGYQLPGFDELIFALRHFPDDTSRRMLACLGVTHALFEPSRFSLPGPGWDEFKARLDASGWIAHVAEAGGFQLWRLTPMVLVAGEPKVSAEVILAQAGRPVAIEMILGCHGDFCASPESPLRIAWRVRAGAGTIARGEWNATAPVLLSNDRAARLRATLPLRLPTGRYALAGVTSGAFQVAFGPTEFDVR